MNKKIKYIDDSYHIPIRRENCRPSTTMYDAAGRYSDGHIDGTTQYNTKTERTRMIQDDAFNDDFSQKYFGSINPPSVKIEGGRSKYINTWREPNGSLSSGGFGPDLKRFSELKIGINTRDDKTTISDMEIDRTHYSYRKYNIYPSMPEPISTRSMNKKKMNLNV